MDDVKGNVFHVFVVIVDHNFSYCFFFYFEHVHVALCCCNVLILWSLFIFNLFIYFVCFFDVGMERKMAHGEELNKI